MVQRGPTRREVLRRAGEVGAAGVVASTAGCLDSLPFVGGADYQQWLHEPGETGSDRDHYGFSYRNQAGILEKEDHLEDDYVGVFEEGAPIIDVDADDIETNLFFGSFWVVEGDFAKDDVAEELEDKGFDDEDDHEGYTIYFNEDPESRYRGLMYAVGDGSAVNLRGFPGDLDTAIDWLEAPIDARTGGADRYVDESDAMATLVNTLGSKHIIEGRASEPLDGSNPESAYFEGMVARGSGVQIEGKRSRLQRVFVFEDEDAASDADVDDWADGHEDGDITPRNGNVPWWEVDDISLNVAGTKVVAKGTIDSEDFGIDADDLTGG